MAFYQSSSHAIAGIDELTRQGTPRFAVGRAHPQRLAINTDIILRHSRGNKSLFKSLPHRAAAVSQDCGQRRPKNLAFSRSSISPMNSTPGPSMSGGIHPLGRPASKKRQGKKSRSVVQRRCGARCGDLAAGLGLKMSNKSGCRGRFAANPGCVGVDLEDRPPIMMEAIGQGYSPSQRSGQFSQVFGAMSFSTIAGMPMSATTISPQSPRPGNSRWSAGAAAPKLFRRRHQDRCERLPRRWASDVASVALSASPIWAGVNRATLSFWQARSVFTSRSRN